MSRLPPIEIAGRQCALPLSEPTAAALLFLLLGSGADDDETAAKSDATSAFGDELAEALTLDPALTLWAAVHHARSTQGESAAPSIAELAGFLERNIAAILRESALRPAENPVEKPAEDRRAACAKLASANVLEAQRATAASDALTDPQYVEALLQTAVDWFAEAEINASAAAALPAWRGRSSSGDMAAPTAEQRAHAQAASDRWLVPSGMASRQFATLAARMLKLVDLEANFAERLLEEKLHALGEFAAGAGHEINNPLAVISGRAQLFLKHEADPQRRRDLAVINAQARRVHEMIADLMLFARPPQPRPAPCDAQLLIEAIVKELAPKAAERNVSLTFAGAKDLPLISADTTQAQVAIRAVIENALDATPDGGAVEVAIELRDADVSSDTPNRAASAEDVAVGQIATSRRLAITVRDNGPGIDAAARRNLFDPFYSGRAAGRGIGMGLSKCWRIVTAHGGRVEIENQPAGGAAVTILLPIPDDTSAAAGGAF